MAHAEDALRAASDALTCKELGAVVIELSGEPKILDLTASRRLTLASAQTNVAALLLRFAAQPDASSAETRWLVRGMPSPRDEGWGQPIFEAELVRNRHGKHGTLGDGGSCDDGLFREAQSRESTSDRGAVVPAPFDRPAAAAPEQGSRSAA